jgi:chaperonin cofactor prefoldin
VDEPMTTFSDLDQEKAMQADDRIIAEAKRRFDYAETYEAHTRQLELEDLKFAYGDSDNQWQWPKDIQDRLDKRVRLTINKARQHCLQVINDAKQNKSSIKVRPTGNGATFKAAEIWEGLIRHIEYQSSAQAVYGYASKFQVYAGVGYWRVVTDYANDDSFDQEIFIKRVKDPKSVYLDPNLVELDALDAKWAFVFDDMPKEDFDEQYPDFRQVASRSTLSTSSQSWIKDKSVRVAEYFRCVPKSDKLLHMTDPATKQRNIVRASKIYDEQLRQQIIDDPSTVVRDIVDTQVEWYLICGDQIVDRRKWPGRYIPIVRLLGDEIEIDSRLERSGHIRYLKDPQRMYNYMSSANVEFTALQGKTPYIAPKQAVEKNLNDWRMANQKNFSVLTYEHVDEDGNQIPAPQRQEPPAVGEAFIQGLQIAQQEMMMASGQYEESFGQRSQAISGKAINERERQGDNATYHFIDQLGISITATGKIIMDLVPKIYDVPRVTKILAQDGTESDVTINPHNTVAYLQQRSKDGKDIENIFNPNVGKYWVQADIGPAYATQRQEAFNAISQIITANKELSLIVGDLLFKSADFPMADKIAERLERMVPAQAKGEGATPQEQEMQANMQALTKDLQTLLADNAKLKIQLKGKDEMRDIDSYKALTERMSILFREHQVTPKDIAAMLHDLMKEEHRVSLQPVVDANDPALEKDAAEEQAQS